MSEPVDPHAVQDPAPQGAEPGPAPSSLVVRPQGEGFYARLSPRPMPSGLQLLGAGAGFGAAGLVMAFLFGDNAWLGAEIAGAILLFGLLLSAFAWLSGWFPVEIVVDDTTINWNGERVPMTLVRDCVSRGGTVELQGEAGRPLGVVHHLRPEAARWLSLAIRASMPASSLSGATPPSG